MREITFREAIREALDEALKSDAKVFLMGEDIGPLGGAFAVTKGLFDKYGRKRVRNTPISEVAIVGAATGAAMAGLRPVTEIMFCDFLPMAGDQIINQAAKMRYMFGGQVKVPLTIRTILGAGLSAAAHHSQSNEALFMHTPGLKLVIPSTPYDAKGLLKTAILDDNPVIYFEHRCLYDSKGPVPENSYSISFGRADVKKEGRDVTLIATAEMVIKSLSVAEELEQEGISVEVIDPRTLNPLDMETIYESVKKTGRVLIVHEAVLTCGSGAEIAARISEEAFDYLDAPVKRLATKDVPIPMAPVLEGFVIPQKEDIRIAVKDLVKV